MELVLRWHKAKRLEVPENISILEFPPYSPELNPIERLWLWLKDHYLSNRSYKDEKELIKEGCKAWNYLTPEIVKSVCADT